MKELPLILLALVFVGLIMFNRRNAQRKTSAETARRAQMQPGTEVMTTSGLYGTLVAVDTEAGTAVLSVAPGVELKWSLAALRDVQELPGQYRGPVQETDEPSTGPDGSTGTGKWDGPEEPGSPTR
ncbi:MAG: preprotein translocase subunit YajC [Frankiales bacterium]|nr:preprotein translocase subunit YajC [Frankiales bacterium]